MEKDYNIDKLLNDIDFGKNMLKNYKGLLLTQGEIEVLNRYNINYDSCSNLNQLLYIIEDILNEEANEDLENVSASIAERNYYQNTNK